MTDSQIKDWILDDLARNKTHYQLLTNALKATREAFLKAEDPLFHEDIKEGFKEAIRQIFTEDIVKRMQFNVDQVMSILEDLDLVKYLEET